MFNFTFENFMHGNERAFTSSYRCFSVSMLPDERQTLENGGKIIMPPSALQTLSRLNVSYPMLFQLKNQYAQRSTHCGVLEFIAEEGKVYMPYWMMRNLLLDEGSLVQVTNVTLPVATFTKFQPMSVDFLDISDPKAVLEQALRNFACLTVGDVVSINYNTKTYQLRVLETKPGRAVMIIECDMNVDFEAPVGYIEHLKEQRRLRELAKEEEELAKQAAERKKLHEEIAQVLKAAETNKTPFYGQGQRLDGKGGKTKIEEDKSGESSSVLPASYVRGVPDFGWKVGQLKFTRDMSFYEGKCISLFCLMIILIIYFVTQQRRKRRKKKPRIKLKAFKLSLARARPSSSARSDRNFVCCLQRGSHQYD